VGQWRLVFFIAAANSIAGCIIYLMFGTSKEQPWNQYAKLNSNKQKMQKLALEAMKCEKVYETESTNDTEKTNFIKER
jgi:hypothetical protein